MLGSWFGVVLLEMVLVGFLVLVLVLGVEGGEVPIVARPPIFIRPKRRKGTERVVTFGAMSRITITCSGFGGMSFDVMVAGL